MAWFKSKEEKRKEEALEAALAQVIFTPESKDEYEKRVGYEVKVIETNDRNKGIVFYKEFDDDEYILQANLELKRRLVDAGIEAIVETNYSFAKGGAFIAYHNFYGLPVAKKRIV